MNIVIYITNYSCTAVKNTSETVNDILELINDYFLVDLESNRVISWPTKLLKRITTPLKEHNKSATASTLHRLSYNEAQIPLTEY